MRFGASCVLAGWTSLAALGAGTHGPASPPAAASPLSPLRELALFDHEPGLKVELAAAEPFVVAPSAFAWDENGVLFVAENRGYPTGGDGGRAMGRIARLEDRDGDGEYDRRTDFALDLAFPNGVLPWRGGLIVTCAPDVLWLKDNDGDGKADVREVLLTGFATNLTTQLRVNHPVLGPDGWVYLASGLAGGRITSPKRLGEPPVPLTGDLRFNPDSGEFQVIDGRAQFGHDFDDHGRRFACYNRVQVQHFVANSGWFARQPGLVATDLLHNCPELVPNPLLRGGGGGARLFPISRNLTTADSHAGTYSAACSVTIWRGGALPDRYLGGAFSCDPTANLVHFDRLEPDGATFAARRLPGTNEFLRSPDDWFRPVFLGTGPDGALYVADMYRRTIEHPDYLPEEVRKRTDFKAGSELGRLWRVKSERRAPRQAASPKPGVSRSRPADGATSAATNGIAGLLSDLSATNSWRRDRSFRLLREGGNRETLQGPLRIGLGAARTARSASLFFHLLASFDGLDEPTLRTALNSPHPELREEALRLGAPKLAGSVELATLAANRARDENPRVRFHAALAIGELIEVAPQMAVPALAQVAARDGRDRWFRMAVLSSIHGQERAFLVELLAQSPQPDDPIVPVLADLGEFLGRTVPPEALGEVFAAVLNGPGTDLGRALSLLGPFTDTAASQGTNSAFDLVAASAGGNVAAKWLVLKEAALGSFDQPGLGAAQRLAAVRLCRQLDPAKTRPKLLELLRRETDPILLAATIRGIADPRSPDGARQLVEASLWASLPSATRLLVVAALADNPRFHPLLVESLAERRIPLALLGAAQKEQLRKSRDPELRSRLGKFLGAATGGDRRAAFDKARASIALKPDPAAGRGVFRRACTACHRLDQEGVAVGPDLFDIRNQTKDAILLHIVIPEHEIAPNFAQYVCETRDGRTVSGLLAADGPSGVVLRQPQGLTVTVPRADIVKLEASPLSLMPQELEKTMTLQELADLLAYLKGEQ